MLFDWQNVCNIVHSSKLNEELISAGTSCSNLCGSARLVPVYAHWTQLFVASQLSELCPAVQVTASDGGAIAGA